MPLERSLTTIMDAFSPVLDSTLSSRIRRPRRIGYACTVTSRSCSTSILESWHSGVVDELWSEQEQQEITRSGMRQAFNTLSRADLCDEVEPHSFAGRMRRLGARYHMEKRNKTTERHWVGVPRRL